MSRRAAGEGSIHKLPDGRWRATVDLPPLDGRRRRRSVTGRTRKEAADKLTRLRKAAADGATLGDTMTVEAWLQHWRTSIAQLKSQTDRGYESKIRVRVVPYIGKVRLDRLTPEHLERLYAQLASEGLAPASVLQVHRILHSALRVAEMRRRITRNPAALVKPPTVPHREAVALTRDQALAALAAAGTRRSAPRWQAGLALGLRQGEALGLTWPRVDLDAGSLAVAAELVWLPYKCGCGEGCKPARQCPRATGGRHVLEEPKSARSRRTLTLPAPLVDALRAWRVTQLQERLALGEKWRGWDHDLVFAQPNGRPTNARADWGDWQDILDEAGVPRMGTHGGRHTTATLLLEAGESMRVVQEVLGHSSYQLTANVYSHVGETLKRGAAEKMGAALWGEV